MGCCKSRGGMFSSAEENPELAGVPIKYRKALASGDGKELGKVFSKECGDILKDSQGEFDKILADINGLKDEMIAGVKKDRMKNQKNLQAAQDKLRAEMEFKSQGAMSKMKEAMAGFNGAADAANDARGRNIAQG